MLMLVLMLMPRLTGLLPALEMVWQYAVDDAAEIHKRKPGPASPTTTTTPTQALRAMMMVISQEQEDHRLSLDAVRRFLQQQQ